MKYLDNNSIISFLLEMSVNYNRIIDSRVLIIDDDVLLVNIGTKAFKLDQRLKTKAFSTFKSTTVENICKQYKRELISEDEAIKQVKIKIQDLQKEVDENEEKNG